MSETDNEKIDNATTSTDSGASDRDTSHHDHGESETLELSSREAAGCFDYSGRMLRGSQTKIPASGCADQG